ncbi:MAG: peptidoglycan DD-metalloendopeptidase family protein [Myxococcota bacterium]
MSDQPNDQRRRGRRSRRGRERSLRALSAALRSKALVFGASRAIAASELISRGVVRVRQGLGHSFETRIGVAALLVLVSAVVGFELGGRVIAAAPRVSVEGLDDAFAHAAHAFDGDRETVRERELASDDDLAGLEGIELASGELVARYAPVAIDALPVHHPVVSEGPVLPAEPAAAPGPAAEDELTLVTEGEIQGSLASSLRRQNVSPAAIHLISTELRKVFDFRRSRAGDVYRLTQDPDGRILDFQYTQGNGDGYSLAWKGTRYVAAKQTEILEPQVAKIAGVVDGSFYDAIMALGEQSALATEFAKILAWDMDFSRHVHPGDEFSILYERMYSKSGDGKAVYVRPGRILAGRYSGRAGEHTVVYYENGEGEGAYFRPDGSSIERAFLAAPLEFSRITSRFTNARRHPILNITRPHPGIDYAAPYGTPIFSVADGVVEFRARAGASGNLIRIRHSGGFTSHYAHLSNFARGLNVGDKVRQKEIIGYVGSTGLSTGPHVCFRVKKDGQYVDPMRIAKPAGPAIKYDRIDHFRDVRDQRLADLGRGPFIAANEAL